MKNHWYSAAQLAAMKLPGLPGNERRMRDRAIKDGWASRQVPGKGGKGGMRTEYQPPKAVIRAIWEHKVTKGDGENETTTEAGSVDTFHKNGATADDGNRDAGLRVESDDDRRIGTVATSWRSAGKVRDGNLRRAGELGRGGDAGRRIKADAAGCGAGVVIAAAGVVGVHGRSSLNKDQRECDTARGRIAGFISAYAGSVEQAIMFLNNEYADGNLNHALSWAYENAWDKPREGRKLNKKTYYNWLEYKARRGSYAPLKVHPDMSIQPWHPLAVALCKRPQGSSKRWIYTQLVEQLGEQAPSSYDVLCTFFRDKLSVIDQLKGRYSGSQLRSHKFYQHRTSAGLAPADEIHADGWNTHFTAPHPHTGEFVTYEVWHFHDVATRYVTQPGIGLTENAEVIAKGLENCIRELGVMVHLQTDSTKVVKGSDRFTKAMHSLEARLGFTWVHPKEVGNSQANGIAENFNTSWLDKKSRELATYQNKNSMDDLVFKRVRKLTAAMVKAADRGDLIERDKKRREAERMGKGLVFESFEQALAWIRQIFSEYNDRPHRALKKIADPLNGKQRHQTPREALNEHKANGWAATLLDEGELIDAFRPHKVLKVTRETVTPWGGMRYRNPEVLGHWNGKEVMVAYDLDDSSKVWVKDMKGAVLCEAEFVGATGYRGQTAREDGDEKRTLATLKRIEKKRDTVLARNPGVVIEAESTVKTIVDFLDVTPQPAPVRELTAADFRQEKTQEKESSYSDTVMWLYGDAEKKEAPKEEVAAR